MSENIPPQALPPFKIALIIENEVLDILHTDDRLSSILLSNPLLVDVTDHVNDQGIIDIIVGATYNADNNTFENPEQP